MHTHIWGHIFLLLHLNTRRCGGNLTFSVSQFLMGKIWFDSTDLFIIYGVQGEFHIQSYTNL